MELYLHIGYPKTATTWLQNVVFPQQHDIGLIGVPQKYSDWGLHLIAAHDFDFDAEFVRNGLLAEATASGKSHIVLSWEHLLGDTAYGGDQMLRHMQRLHQCFPEARIIVFIREQRSMITSIYKQYVQEGGTWSARGFLQSTYPYRIQFSLAYLNYARVIAAYKSLFGDENVYVSLFERIHEDPQGTVSDLLTWMNLPDAPVINSRMADRQNVSLSWPSLQCLRLLNAVLPSRFNGRGPVPFTNHVRVSRYIVRQVLEKIIDPFLVRPVTRAIGYTEGRVITEDDKLNAYFAAANTALLDAHHLPLNQYGYLLEPSD